TIFEVRLNASSYQLPVHVLHLESQAEHVHVIMAKVAGQQKAQLEQAASSAGRKLVSLAVDYKVTVSANGQLTEVHDFGGAYIIRALVLNDEVAGDRMTAVLYDPVARTLSFVPAVTLTRADGSVHVLIKVPHNSIYAVMGST